MYAYVPFWSESDQLGIKNMSEYRYSFVSHMYGINVCEKWVFVNTQICDMWLLILGNMGW